MTVTIPLWPIYVLGGYLLVGAWVSFIIWRDRWEVWGQLALGVVIWPYLLLGALGDEQFWALRAHRKRNKS